MITDPAGNPPLNAWEVGDLPGRRNKKEINMATTKIFTGTLRVSPIGGQELPIQISDPCPACDGTLYKKNDQSRIAVCFHCQTTFVCIDGKWVLK
jgi:hypothetical protein